MKVERVHTHQFEFEDEPLLTAEYTEGSGCVRFTIEGGAEERDDIIFVSTDAVLGLAGWLKKNLN